MPAPVAGPQPPIVEPEPPKPEEPERVRESVSGIPLTTLETDNQAALFRPDPDLFDPYVARAFENSIEWHKQRFQWEPWDRTTVLIKDFGDYGNASARSSPNNGVTLDVAPLSQRMETFSPGERFFTLINHELAHVATLDVYNRKDAAGVAGRQADADPGASGIDPLQLSDDAADQRSPLVCRGSAVFFETWMAGSLGRAQGGYDEMVFRPRSATTTASPLGLESEGIAIDFMIGANDYLYGTRFFSWLALTYGPDKVMQWLRRDEDSAAFYATQFRRVFGKSLDDAWSDWHAWSASSSAAISPGCRPIR